MRTIDLTGQRFGRLVVKSRAGSDKYGQAKWQCHCDCGNITIVLGGNLKKGNTTSCGCIQREAAIKANTTHGETHSREYGIWLGIKARCLYPNATSYPRYGGRGITLYEPWVHDFAAFLEHVGRAPGAEYSIDRINNDLGYLPGNIRWSTTQEQNRNTRRNRRIAFLAAGGKFMFTLSEWAERVGLPADTFRYRFAHKIDEMGDAMEQHLIDTHLIEAS